MVGIVTGLGLGLERSSGWILGSKGMLGNAGFGRYGENVYVNAATGNLAITRTDEILIGQGPDSVLTRVYNSLAGGDADNNDHWRMSAQRQITTITGTLNTSGSTVKRIDWDGSDELYTYDTSLSCYTFTGGPGAKDKLAYVSDDGTGHPAWIWTDGSTQQTEHYTLISNGSDTYFARLDTLKDTDGNKITYTYAGTAATDMLTVVTTTPTTGTAEYTDLLWSGTNLTALETHLQDGTRLTRTLYTYDGENRLSTVTTDLSSNDNSISDGKAVTTTYTYTDSTSKLVASISQTGGALLVIAYTTQRKRSQV